MAQDLGFSNKVYARAPYRIKDALHKTTPSVIASNVEVNSIPADAKVTLVGFGNNDVEGASTHKFGLKVKTDAATMPLKRDANTPDADLQAAENRLFFDSRLEFFAGGDGNDTCLGDSGGPAYIEIDSKAKLIGITSREVNTGDRDACGIGSV